MDDGLEIEREGFGLVVGGDGLGDYVGEAGEEGGLEGGGCYWGGHFVNC